MVWCECPQTTSCFAFIHASLYDLKKVKYFLFGINHGMIIVHHRQMGKLE